MAGQRKPRAATPESGSATAVDLCRLAMRAYDRGDFDQLADLVHPDAVIEMVVLEGGAARGPRGVTDALTRAQEQVHRPTMTRLEPLGDDAVVMIGRIQYTDSRRGLTDRQAAWLTVLKDGLIWRTRVLDSPRDAQRVYEELVSGDDE